MAMGEMNSWISGITSLGSMLTAWTHARNAGLNDEPAKAAAMSARSVGGVQAQTTSLHDVVIREELLNAYVLDIQRAEKRFVDSITASKNTPTDRDRGAVVARKSTCVHLQKVRDHNAGHFPSPELEQLWSTCQCTGTND